MLQLTTTDIKYFNKFIDMLCSKGESIMVTKNGMPFYRIEPIMDKHKPESHYAGLSFNKIIIDDPFDENL